MSGPRRPDDADLRAERAREAFLAEWSKRPTEEFAEFVASLSQAPDDTPRNADPLGLAQAREVAAVSGSVRPRDLAPARRDRAQEADILGTLAPDFDRSVVRGRMMWTMRSPQRASTLRRLIASPHGVSKALDLAASVETDAAGELLRRILGAADDTRASDEGRPLPATVIGDASPADIAQALVWASGAGGSAAQLALATARAHVSSILKSYTGLLDYGLVGRADELSAIQAFIDAPATPDRPTRILTVSGIGGAGKSTLLAAALAPRLTATLDGRAGPAVVVIDLDRVAFRPHADAELTQEVAHQLEAAWPELAGRIASERAAEIQARLERKEFASAGAGSMASERSIRSSTGLEWRLAPIIRDSARGAEAVTVVLDTYEEWQRTRPYSGARGAWNDPENVMSEWFIRLASWMGLRSLNVIIAGRAESTILGVEELPLYDLDPGPAAEMLQRLGIDAESSARLAPIVGGNPLTLRVAARFFKKLSPAERTSFLATSTLDPKLDEHLRRAILYDRFIEHIGDTSVKKLAHPGLLLRRVTPEIIRDVLAEPCGFPEMSIDEAAELLEKLADEVWLVQRMEDGSVQHRPEVRRSMISLMARDRAFTAPSREIHERAARWYNPSPQDDDPMTEENIEAFYHRMMLETGTPPVYPSEWDSATAPTTDPRYGRSTETSRRAHERRRRQVARYARELGEDVAELPLAVESQLRLARGDLLTPVQANALPPDLWSSHVASQGRALVDNEDPESAIALFDMRPWPRTSSRPNWLGQAYCDSARWDDYAFNAFTEGPRGPAPSHGAFWTGPATRHEFVNVIVCSSGEARQEVLHPAPDHESADFPPYVRAFLLALGRSATGHSARKIKQPAPTEYAKSVALPVDQLRQYIVHLLTGAPLPWNGRPPVFPDMSGLLVPDPDVMRSFSSLTGDDAFLRVAQQLEDLVRRTRTRGRRGSAAVLSHDVFGSVAATISKERFEANSFPIPLNADAGRALRGDNPELRPAIRRVLHAVAPDEQWLKTLGDIATPLLAIPPANLRPDELPLMSDSGTVSAFITLIEYVDRSRVTPHFLRQARDALPDGSVLDSLVRAFDRWDAAHDKLLDELSSPPRAGLDRI